MSNNMGELYHQLGDYETALFHYKTALSIDRLSLGDSPASVEGTYTALRLWRELHASVAGTYTTSESF
jgi:hypothetical protein